MEEIITKLKNRKEQLKKECWSNKIRINEIDRIIDLLKKETPVAGTTDVKTITNNTIWIDKLSKQVAKSLTSYDTHEE